MVKKGWPIPAVVMAYSRPCRETVVQPKRGGLGASAGGQMCAGGAIERTRAASKLGEILTTATTLRRCEWAASPSRRDTACSRSATAAIFAIRLQSFVVAAASDRGAIARSIAIVTPA
jgi:hypothetical protein